MRVKLTPEEMLALRRALKVARRPTIDLARLREEIDALDSWLTLYPGVVARGLTQGLVRQSLKN
jgi:hypothetical protein